MRTDRTQVCVHCALRMSRRERACPRCQGTLHDLTRASDRGSALRLLAGTPRKERWRRRFVALSTVKSKGTASLVIVVMLVAMGFALASFLGHPLFCLGLIVLSLGGIAGTFYAVLSTTDRRLFTAVGQPERRMALLPEGRPPDGPIVIRGQVRVTDPITSPLGRVPCAAWRVAGRTTYGAVDDARATGFEIIGDPAGPVRVDEGVALVVVEVGPAEGSSISDETRAWLGERLVNVSDAVLEEGVLRDGDRVLVCAHTQTEAPGSGLGFRDAARIRVVAGTAHHPLRIERS